MANTPAMESIFANAQQNAASLIETATLAINAKVNTIEEAEKIIQELSTEAVMFNQLLTTIMNAMRQVESGDMQKEEAAGIIAPAVKELKDKCTALKIANADAPGDDITEDEIAILRELIIGAKAAAEDRLVAIRMNDDERTDPDVEAELEEAAEEGFISRFLERRHNAKISKQRINVFWESLASKKSTDILNQFAKAILPLCEGKDKNHVKNMVEDMIREDQKSNQDYTDKLSAKDYIVKSYKGYYMAIMPGTTDGLGCHHILAPVTNNDGDCYFFKKKICTLLIEPVESSEVEPAKEAYEEYEAEVAMEAGFLAAKYVNTNDTKTAKALYSNAKKLYSLGEKDKALGYMKKAKSLYEKALNALLKSGKFEKSETVTKIVNGSMRRTITHTDSMTFSIARASLEQKVDRCTAYVLQWTTKAGKETYQQTLDQLKAERDQAKAAKKAAKATENYESEEFNMDYVVENFNYDEFMFACESYMDEMMTAMEADEAEAGDAAEGGKSPSALASKVRAAGAKLRSAFKRGDKAAVEEAQREVDEAVQEIADGEEAAPPEKKKSWKKAVGIAAAVVATIAVIVGFIKGAKTLKDKGERVNPKTLANLARQTTSTAVKNTTKNVGNAVSSKIEDIKDTRSFNKVEKGKDYSPEDLIRHNRKFINETEKHKAERFEKTAKPMTKYTKQKNREMQKAAKAAAKAAKEAFGVSEFDAYAIIYEALCDDYEYYAFESFESDADFVNAIEAML